MPAIGCQTGAPPLGCASEGTGVNEREAASRWINGTAVGMLIAAIFITDLFTDWAIAVAVLYVVPLLLSLRLFAAYRVRWLAAACVLLTLLGSPLARFGSPEAGFVNVAISVTAIVTTTYLGLRMLSIEAASHEARAQLQRLSRIGNLGELTASIAHEVNQPLAALTASAGAGRRWLAADPPDIGRASESFERIARDAARAGEVVAGVRRLASRRPPTPEPTSLNPLVEDSVSIARAEIERRHVRLRVDLAERLPLLFIDRVQIQQVVLNLILNAIESLAEGPLDDRELWVVTRAAGRSVTLAVADNGPGLSKKAQEHLWEPFWTGKEGGIGLGLTMSRAIAETHGGTLTFAARPAAGAMFELQLPAKAEE